MLIELIPQKLEFRGLSDEDGDEDPAFTKAPGDLDDEESVDDEDAADVADDAAQPEE
jgi:hypothetical protein